MINLKKISILAFSLFISQQVYAVPTETIINNAQGRLEYFATNFFSTLGYSETIKLINGTKGEDPKHEYQNRPVEPAEEGDDTSGGPLTVIENGTTVTASPDPSQVGKGVSADVGVQAIIKALKASPDGKVVVHYTKEGKNMVAVAWDKRALMKGRADQVSHFDFIASIGFEDPHS